MLAAEENYEATLKANGENEPKTNEAKIQKVSTKILADGTYASEIKEETGTGTYSSNERQLPNIKSKKIVYFLKKLTPLVFRIILGGKI